MSMIMYLIKNTNRSSFYRIGLIIKIIISNVTNPHTIMVINFSSNLIQKFLDFDFLNNWIIKVLIWIRQHNGNSTNPQNLKIKNI